MTTINVAKIDGVSASENDEGLVVKIDISAAQVTAFVIAYAKDMTHDARQEWFGRITSGRFAELMDDLERAEAELQVLRNADAMLAINSEEVRRAGTLALCGRRAEALEVLADAAGEYLGRRI